MIGLGWQDVGCEWKDRDLVFPSQVGTPLEDKAVRRAFVRTCRRANVPLIRFHDLRHTSATLLLGAGVHPRW
jgi:integrase